MTDRQEPASETLIYQAPGVDDGIKRTQVEVLVETSIMLDLDDLSITDEQLGSQAAAAMQVYGNHGQPNSMRIWKIRDGRAELPDPAVPGTLRCPHCQVDLSTTVMEVVVTTQQTHLLKADMLSEDGYRWIAFDEGQVDDDERDTVLSYDSFQCGRCDEEIPRDFITKHFTIDTTLTTLLADRTVIPEPGDRFWIETELASANRGTQQKFLRDRWVVIGKAHALELEDEDWPRSLTGYRAHEVPNLILQGILIPEAEKREEMTISDLPTPKVIELVKSVLERKGHDFPAEPLGWRVLLMIPGREAYYRIEPSAGSALYLFRMINYPQNASTYTTTEMKDLFTQGQLVFLQGPE